MTAIGPSLYEDGLDQYLLVGEGDRELPTPSYWSNTSDLIYAKRMAMAWLIAGYSTRVINLKLDHQGWAFQDPSVEYFAGTYKEVMPEIAGRYGNLQSVKDEAAKFGVEIPRYSMQIIPPLVPFNLTDAQFFAWLRELALSPPTWDRDAYLQSLKAQQVTVKAQSVEGEIELTEADIIHERPERGSFVHILHLHSQQVLCGCEPGEGDRPFDEPLRRAEAASYCPQCVDGRQRWQADLIRGWSRSVPSPLGQIGFMPGPAGESEVPEEIRQQMEAWNQHRPKPVWDDEEVA